MFLAHINKCPHKLNLALWKIRLQNMFGLFSRASNSLCVFNKIGIKLTLNWNLCTLHKTFSNTTDKTYQQWKQWTDEVIVIEKLANTTYKSNHTMNLKEVMRWRLHMFQWDRYPSTCRSIKELPGDVFALRIVSQIFILLCIQVTDSTLQ